jgi:hypothetical protein
MKFNDTIRLFSELRKSEIIREGKVLLYNNFKIDNSGPYFKHLDSLLDNFYAEFQLNYFETSRELIEFLLVDLEILKRK